MHVNCIVKRVIIFQVRNSGEEWLLYCNSRILNGRFCLGWVCFGGCFVLFYLFLQNQHVFKSLQNKSSKVGRNSGLSVHRTAQLSHWFAHKRWIMSLPQRSFLKSCLLAPTPFWPSVQLHNLRCPPGLSNTGVSRTLLLWELEPVILWYYFAVETCSQITTEEVPCNYYRQGLLYYVAC